MNLEMFDLFRQLDRLSEWEPESDVHCPVCLGLLEHRAGCRLEEGDAQAEAGPTDDDMAGGVQVGDTPGAFCRVCSTPLRCQHCEGGGP